MLAEHHIDMVVTPGWLGVTKEAQPAGHPEMDQQATGSRLQQEILAATINACKPTRMQRLVKVFRDRPTETSIANCNRRDRWANDPWSNAAPDGFDLGQLRHLRKPN